jgi:hypothetical protein
VKDETKCARGFPCRRSRPHFVIFTNSGEVCPQARLPFFRDGVAAFFGAEDQMDVLARIRVGHNAAPSGAYPTSMQGLPPLEAVGYDMPSLAGLPKCAKHTILLLRILNLAFGSAAFMPRSALRDVSVPLDIGCFSYTLSHLWKGKMNAGKNLLKWINGRGCGFGLGRGVGSGCRASGFAG